MRYPPHILDEIRTRLPASDVIGRRVRLKKAGREWKGLSPFNAEKTPSFCVNDQKQFYHCFSSGKHGDIFTFLMETEGLSFPEAVERLAGEAGVALPKPTADTDEAEARRKGALEVLELAALFFEERLRSRAGAEARAYLDRRALGEGVRKTFRLGYAPPERFALRDHLAEKGVDKALMLELGLLSGGEDVAVPFDKFRDRVIFPILDARGRVIAFGGRAMRADARAKYLNSPDTPLFHKGRVLYNLHAARKSAHERGRIIAVEGYVDVIAMTLAGYPETVAPLGTALTEDQLGLLWRHADEPILCFDGDKAGQKAAFRALDVALPMLEPGKSLRFAMLPQGQDPDDLLRSGGAKAISTIINDTTALIEMIWSRAENEGEIATPEQRARFSDRLYKLAGTINNKIVRELYIKELKGQFYTFSNRLSFRKEVPNHFIKNKSRASNQEKQLQSSRINVKFDPIVTGTSTTDAIPQHHHREAMIVSSLLVHPELLGIEAEDLAGLDLENADARALRSVLLDRAADGVPADPEVMAGSLERADLAEAAERLAALVRPGDRWALDPHTDPLRLENTLRQAVILHRKAGTLNSELRQAERALVEDESEASLAWLCDVKERLAVVAAAEAEVPEMDEFSTP